MTGVETIDADIADDLCYLQYLCITRMYQMKTSHKGRDAPPGKGLLHLARNGRQSRVRAAAEDGQTVSHLNNEAHLVGKPIWDKMTTCLAHHAGVFAQCRKSPARMGHHVDTRSYRMHMVELNPHKTVAIPLQEPGLDADIVSLSRTAFGRPAVLSACLTQVQRRIAVAGKEGLHTVGMVVVRVREHGKINVCEVDSQSISVTSKDVRLTKVEQETQVTVGHVHAEAMLA